jgi:hypothetical protein
MYWDITVYDKNQQLVLGVEIKSIPPKSAQWVSEFSHTLLSHNLGQLPRFLLLVLPDTLYLWQTSQTTSRPDIELIQQSATEQLFHPYLERLSVRLDRLSHASLELMVVAWLDDVMHTPTAEVAPTQRWVVTSGLQQAIAGGFIAQEAMV